MPGSQHNMYYKLLETMQKSGCPICNLVESGVAHYLDSLIYEQVNNIETRKRTRAAQGFCHTHSWQLRQQGGALGIAMIYRDVIRDVLDVLEKAKYSKPRIFTTDIALSTVGRNRLNPATSETVKAIGKKGECPACHTQHRIETNYIDLLIENLENEDLISALRENDGLCVPHLRLALSRLRKEKDFISLLACTSTSYSRLLDDLDEMIRLHDYRYQKQGLDEVGDSWIRAIKQIAGSEKSM